MDFLFSFNLGTAIHLPSKHKYQEVTPMTDVTSWH